ncbi:hypothetical protein GGF48_000590 [Coemansia sp. RSA 921]|nr:hypothetical protein LPJ54_000826 [Coemansia sp. RSA 1824]KAJ2132915.1 hypothetical protein GGF48_000590 [Coemansia sp. RSA 921]KAJ2170404.1 hypothetical protein GGF45_005332 [Coemansia sp. RSA 551]KAJ2270872.1 hypothetical protein GGH14_005076 [Coemansia sp. RSA 370]KAJ2286045.1 hypothetical protein IW141_005520 [Coemansia sp. RSA 355]KAJ2547830.1 hypothetical protein IWW35_004446 [Coemansia sp. RSA 1878]
MPKRRAVDIECDSRAMAFDAGRPIAIISTHGPSVLSAALAPPKSRLRRTSLLARNLRQSMPLESDDDETTESSTLSTRKRRRRRSRKHDRAHSSTVKPWSLLVADIASRSDLAEMRQALELNPDARCSVEFSGDYQHPCIMTLCQDGFVWNQEAFLDRRSGQFESVARRNPFMHSVNSSDHDAGGGSEMVQLYPTTVHEIHDEDCPRLL